MNLPAAQKMSRPRYQEVSSASIPIVEQDGARVRIVAGEYGCVRGPVTEIAAQPLYMDVTLSAGAEFCQPVPQGHTLAVYVFEGEGLFGMDTAAGGEIVPAVRMLFFGDGDQLHVQAGPEAPVRFMLMAGAPFGEPIAPYGPFVMSTENEIRQALFNTQ